MNPDQEIDNLGKLADDADTDESVSVDEFIKQLEAKEKDLHITADTTIIEIADSFDDGNLPDFIVEDLQKASVAIEPIPTPARPKRKPKGAADADELMKEIADLKEQISQLDADRKDILEASRRRARDFENFKSRTERERHDTFQNQVGNLATQMLPALDNLNRAIDFASELSIARGDDMQQFFDGIVLVNQQVNEVLAEMGVQPIASVGEFFDPHYHEAVATEESDEFEPNTISAELLRGYRIGERVIRHSMVRVAKAPAARTGQDETELNEQEEGSHDQNDTRQNEAE